jgi:hypothetical protein
MGGFVSALQRIQSPPTEGDSLYNLSLLFHGSKSVFVAPITGAVFATLLYLMFTAGIVKGSFFPEIFTPDKKSVETAAKCDPSDTPKTKSNTNTNTNSNMSANTNVNTNSGPNSNVTPNSNTNNNLNSNVKVNSNSDPDPASSPAMSDSNTSNDDKKTREEDTQKDVDKLCETTSKGLNIFDFLARSGPLYGNDYALLIIWCFIAGFAERFVPDALDRLISNSKSNGKK